MLTLAVALAAGFGSVLRYLTDRAVAGRWGVPWGTLVVNVVGSFGMGLAATSLTGDGHTVVAAGLAGGYTTMSTLAWETLVLAERATKAAVLNVLGSATTGLTAAAAGLWLGAVALPSS